MITKLIKLEGVSRGKVKFNFFQLEVFKMLLEDFGYSYIRIRGKGKLLKSIPGGYEFVPIWNLRDRFTQYLKETFNRESIPKKISYEDFMNKYYQSNPITHSYASSYFSTECKLHEKDFILDGNFLKFK